MSLPLYLDVPEGGIQAPALNPTALEINIHHTDGCCTHFTQTDPLAIQSLIDHLNPEAVFHQPQIFLADKDSLSVYQTSSIASIEVIMEGFPDWNYRPGVDHVREITEEEFQAVDDQPGPYLGSSDHVLIVQIDMVNGDRHFQRIYGPPISAFTDLTTAIKSQFNEKRCLMARRMGLGAILINAANVKRMLFYPRSPLISNALPPGTWPANELSINETPTALLAA